MAPVHKRGHFELQRHSAHNRLRGIRWDALHEPSLDRTRHATLANPLAPVAMLECLVALSIPAGTHTSTMGQAKLRGSPHKAWLARTP